MALNDIPRSPYLLSSSSDWNAVRISLLLREIQACDDAHNTQPPRVRRRDLYERRRQLTVDELRKIQPGTKINTDSLLSSYII